MNHSACALCKSTQAVSAHAVAPRSDVVSLCNVCTAQIVGGDLDANHWFCLQESAWSETPAVQVLAYRLLVRLRSESWANDLLEQLYLQDDVQSWARDENTSGEVAVVKDCNGTTLADGDSVTLIKDLTVKGAGFTAKRGTLVRKIRLGSDPTHVEGRVNKTVIFLKTEFLKRAQ